MADTKRNRPAALPSGSPEFIVSRAERERWALAQLPATDPLVRVEVHRLVEAVEQVRRSARLLGLEPIEQYASLAVRADAFIHRVRLERAVWRRVRRSALFRVRETLWPELVA